MMESDLLWSEIDQLVLEMAQGQQENLLSCGRRLVPNLTADDVLQPNDFPELENHPYFRYEEGILAGIQSVQMALWALKKSAPPS